MNGATRVIPVVRFPSGGTVPETISDTVVEEARIRVEIVAPETAFPDGSGTTRIELLASPTDLTPLVYGALFRIYGVLPAQITIASGNHPHTLRVTVRGARSVTARERPYRSAGALTAKHSSPPPEPPEPPNPQEPVAWPLIPVRAILEAAETLQKISTVRAETGGVHVAMYVSGSTNIWAEDISRHSAIDRVVGRLLSGGVYPWPGIIALSCRISGDIVERSTAINAQICASVSAPTASAIDVARTRGITLCGFVRDGRLNAYSRADRLMLNAGA